MKDLFKSWQFWVVFGIIAAIIIVAVVCHLVQPQVSYAWLEIVSAISFALGFSCGIIVYHAKEK